MPCALTGSQLADCKDAIGGIKEIKIKVHPGLATIEADFTASSGSVTAVAAGSRSSWYSYYLEKNTSSISDNPQPNAQNGTLFFQPELKVILNKLSARLSNEVKLLGQSRLLVCVRDFNDSYFFVGLYFGLDMTAGTVGTGTARGDRSGYDLTFQGQETLPIQFTTSAIYASLVS